MLKTLFTKLSLALLLIFILLSILTLSVTFIASNLYQQEIMQKLNAEVANHIVKDADIFQDNQINHSNLRKLFHSVMILNPNLEIYLLNHDGEILEYSAPAWKVVRLSINLEPIKRYLSTSPTIPIQGEDPRDASRSKIFTVASVPFKNQPNGYLYIILGGEIYDSIVERIQNSYILSSTLIAIGVCLIIIFIFAVFLFSLLTRRLKNLATTVTSFEKNPHHLPSFPKHRIQGDEIDQLTAVFKTMAQKIHYQLDSLQASDHLRRELVANVSHDLRTPLATLQGYIETLLLKEAELTVEQRNQYLQIAIRHCHRLNKLVSELFELAKLDAKESKAHKESFNIAELIEDIMQKFSLPAEEKEILLSTHYSSHDLYAYADISLIERVIENLLENALRFAPKNGFISISLENSPHHITLKISDNGSGIPESELPFIFDRFYQLDKNRSTESQHSGLGLAIVKRIIDLHQCVINVNSIPNRGTTFSFTLSTHQN